MMIPEHDSGGHGEASSNGRTADFGSAHEGSNPSASASPSKPEPRHPNQRAELRPLPLPEQVGLLAVGEVPRALLVEAGQAVHDVFAAEVALLPAQPRPAYAFNKDRQQYHSTAILRRLAQLSAGPGAVPVLGLTDVDLFLPDTPFVFGEADRDARSAVLSLFRLAHGPEGKPAEPDRLRRRAQVEAVHEVGHLVGLSHCQDAHCAMYLSHKPSDSDRKGPGLCGACRSALGLSGPRT